MKLTFHGAARTVTGSLHLLEAGGQRVLIDCGLFQGLKKLRRLNWEEPGFEPGFLDHVVLTHSHIDHTGYVPRLMQYGFQGGIHCTPATAELVELMLMDSAHIQEEDAAYANKKGFSKHRPAEPLYTSIHALQSLKLLQPVKYNRWVKLSARLKFRLVNSGHILGAAFVEFRITEDMRDSVHPGEITVVFSGDVGRYDVPLHSDPEPLPDNLEDLAGRPEARNLINIYAGISGQTPDAVIAQVAGQQFGQFKPLLADLAVAHLSPIADEMHRLMGDVSEIDRILGNGANRAAEIAEPILAEAFDIVGFVRSR